MIIGKYLYLFCTIMFGTICLARVRTDSNKGSYIHTEKLEKATFAGGCFCINSAALRFIPKEDLEKEGYGQYKKLFNK